MENTTEKTKIIIAFVTLLFFISIFILLGYIETLKSNTDIYKMKLEIKKYEMLSK